MNVGSAATSKIATLAFNKTASKNGANNEKLSNIYRTQFPNVFWNAIRFATLCCPVPGIAKRISRMPPPSANIASFAVTEATRGSPPKAPQPQAPKMRYSIC